MDTKERQTKALESIASDMTSLCFILIIGFFFLILSQCEGP